MMGEIMQRPHGIKRAAADDLEREQRLAKRFNLLNIDQSGRKHCLPLAAKCNSHRPPAVSISDCDEPISYRLPDPPIECDGMQVEDTPNRIYISDLDAEIAALEPSSPTHPIFLPDIEKHLLQLPASILAPSAEEEEERRERERSMQLVVYNIPTSLSVPEDRDTVRWAIEEARQRVRDRMPLGGQIKPPAKAANTPWDAFHNEASAYLAHSQSDDMDAMDMG